MAVYTTIDNPELYFQVKTYTGNATDDTAITLDGDENMQPDLVWIKDRDNANHHRIYDAVRGATKVIYSSLTSAEGTASDGLKSFDSDGFTLGDGSDENGNTAKFAAWCWKESATAGFDIVSYTGNNTAGATVSHGLSQIPDLMIFKNRDDGDTSWCVYHSAHGTTATGRLNTTNAFSDTTFITTTPSSSVFTLTATTIVNGSSHDIIAYLFASKQGFSKFGSYEGNGNADGTYVHLGFSPSFVMLKEIDQTGNWCMSDNKRPGYNPTNMVNANENGAETTDGTNTIDHLSNGFKLRTTGSSSNTSDSTYIYMAFAEAPFVNSNGVPCNAR